MPPMHQNRQAGKKEVPDNRLLIVSCKYFVHKTFNRKSCKKLEKKKENHAGIVTSNHLVEIKELQQKIPSDQSGMTSLQIKCGYYCSFCVAHAKEDDDDSS